MMRIGKIGLVAVGVAVCILIVAQFAFAANGDNLRQIIADRTGTGCVSYDAEGNHSSVGVGIAFDGTNLLISCYLDNSIVEINPADGSQIAVHFIAGASSLGAMAWDATNSKLWACSSFGTVGIVDLALNTYAPVFDTYTVLFPGGYGGSGCFDGLAYDGVDDTIWASGDVSDSVEHYTAAGAAISRTPGMFGLLGGCGNSGLAVGGSKLYLGNNGCSQIYESPKDFSAVVLFATFPRRIEDLECDPVTFAASGVGAIWNIDAYDNILNAYEVPSGECGLGGKPVEICGNGIDDDGDGLVDEDCAKEICGDGVDNDGDGLVDEDCPIKEGRMTGGGSVGDFRHGFELHCDATSGQPNRLQTKWGVRNKFHLESLYSAVCTNNPTIAPNPPAAPFDTYVGEGSGRYNGVSGYTAKWTFTDAGEPGVNDSMSITVMDPSNVVIFSTSGTLQHGNHQAHSDNLLP